jgi:glycosyltransferase involved in cell wall biosynthesis
MSRPSVLGIVSYKVFPAQMGGQKCVAGFYDHLSLQTKVILAVSKENRPVENGPYKVFPFLYNHWWGIFNIAYLYKLIKLVKDHSIDLIIIEHSYFGWIGILLRFFTNKPFVIRSHNIEACRFRDMQRSWWKAYGWYERKVHRWANHSFFITPEDRNWALTHWQLDSDKCTVISYGTDIPGPVSIAERSRAKEELLAAHGLPSATRLFLFNGSLDYLPNTDALRIIINELLPLLNSMLPGFRIFICGKGLDIGWEKVLNTYPNLIYKGFVQDIGLYLKGADHFINPITLGGGIRIKLVEALAHNQPAISTRTGAQGIAAKLVDDKLVLVEDYDWPAFAKAMTRAGLYEHKDIPAAFYVEFNWDTIVRKALLSLQTL